ncbi:MAG: AMP-binding protein [Dehalococcoidia bacterium]
MNFETSDKNVLGQLLDEKAERSKDKPFLYFEDEKITCKEIRERVNKVANGFVRMGIKKDDKVAIIMENCPEYVYTWFALSKIGAIEVPINTFHKGSILEYLINYSDAETLVISDSVIPQIKAIEDSLENIKKVIVHGSTREARTLRFATESYQTLLDNPSSFPPMDVRHNDLMAIMFTSGTTGPSKGVMITHNQAIFVASQYVDFLKLSGDDLFYHYIPLFHEAGQFAGVMAPLLADIAIVLKKGFSATGFWDDIRKYGCTISGMFEAVLNILYKAPETDDDTNNPLRVCATAHIPPDIHEPFEKRFGVRLVNVYGMTEGDCTVSATYDDIKIGSFGKPRGYFDARIFDTDDRELPSNKVGELALRPLQPHIMFEGYYKMPENTLATFRNLWWHTGDLAYKDDEGYFYFFGREKDMIRRGGENISALEVEGVVMSHPDVKECAAVAVESDIWGEEVKIVVIPKEARQIKPEELVAYCDERMAYFMVPRYIEFIEDFPRTGASQRPIKGLLKNITPTTWDRVRAGVKITREREKGKKK